MPIAALALVASAACAPTGDAARGDRETALPDSVEMVGAGSISTEAVEFGSSVTADGEFYFNRVVESAFSMMRANLATGEAPTRVSLVDPDRAIDPFVTPDGRLLYFSSNAPTSPDDTTEDYNTWVAERIGGDWRQPRPLPAPINSDANEVFVSADRDGSLYFGRAEPDGPRRFFTARRTGDGFAAPVPLALETGDARIGNPSIAADGAFLVFWATTGPDGTGPSDLLISCRTAEGGSAPIDPGPPVNSEWAELAPHVDPAGRWLYFTSERPGIVPTPADGSRPPGDLYRYPVERLGLPCEG